eukprot:sb/3478078/
MFHSVNHTTTQYNLQLIVSQHNTTYTDTQLTLLNTCHATQSVSLALNASRKLTPGLRPGVRADRQGICQLNTYHLYYWQLFLVVIVAGFVTLRSSPLPLLVEM